MLNPSSRVFLNVENVHNFVFDILLASPSRAAYESMGPVGDLQLEWKNTTGSNGSLCVPLKLKNLVPTLVDFVPLNLLSHMSIEKPASILFELTNTSSQPQTLTLYMDRKRMSGILTTGPTKIMLGHLQPEEKTQLTLDVFPILTMPLGFVFKFPILTMPSPSPSFL